ncbi:MAG: VCBS repeat-containing protein, partial [Polyangiales bacterium]
MRRLTLLVSLLGALSCSNGINDDGPGTGGSSTGGERNAICATGDSGGDVREPVFVANLRGQTSWYASPVVADLDGDGSNELIAAYYSVYIFDEERQLLADSNDGDEGRVYAPHVVVDLEGDGSQEIIVGRGHRVVAYAWSGNSSALDRRWVADTTSAGNQAEVRGLAAADLDGDGLIEVVATTTQTASTADGGAQVFVFDVEGRSYQPSGGHEPAWPRYNNRSGEGNDADRNLQGHSGFGCYGLNVAIGDIDDDPELEIIATYDNHHIQAFNHDGVAVDSAPWFTNRASEFAGQRLTWGQFIRWADPQVEADHYHEHRGDWPHPSWAEWLQWTASPPNIVDLDGDGDNEVLGIPNVEMHEPYETQAYALMVLEGAYDDGTRSAMRLPRWEELPRGERPILVDGWYPPRGVPAAATVNLQGNDRPEILVSLNDGFLYAFDSDAQLLWRFNYTHGHQVMYASEPVVADLNQDGSPEVLFATYGAPNVQSSGNLVVLAADGTLLHDIALPNPGSNGNGNGAPAAPSVGDLDGDGELEIFVQTFDHGLDVFTVPGSGTACLPWPTARGGPLRMGQPNG